MNDETRVNAVLRAHGTMKKERDWTMTKGVLAWLGLTMMAVAATAQTTVTTSGGTTNTVPVFTGSATVGNSPISVSGSNVGIGTASPTTQLQVTGQLSAGSNPARWGTGVSSISGNFNQGTDQGIGFLLQGISTGQSAATGTGSLMQFQQDYVNTWSIGMTPSQSRFSFFLQRGIGGSTGTEVMSLVDSNVGIGTTSPQYTLDVTGTVHATGLINAATSGVKYPDGNTQTTAWTGVLCGGDYAEDMRADKKKESYEPGDVLVLSADDNSDVQKSVEPYSAMVAGIYATKPGVVGLRDAVAKFKDNVPMAMVGVVPTKVSAENGPIHKGDLLVTSSLKGFAMKGTDRSRMLGAVIGKAMGSLDSGTGVIEVLVTLQ